MLLMLTSDNTVEASLPTHLTYREDHDPQNQCYHQTRLEEHGFSGIFLVWDLQHLG